MTADDPFHLTLEVRAPGRMPALRRMFEELKQVKQRQFGDNGEEGEDQSWPDSDSPHWRALLDEEGERHFAGAFDSSSEEGKIHAQLMMLTHHSKRSDPMLRPPGPWDFGSMIEAILCGEYLLVEIVALGGTRAKLRYDPLAGPFGGTESLVELVEGFGQRVVHDSWHEGPHKRTPVGWDYERAKQLVVEGRGL